MGHVYRWLGSDEQAKKLWQNEEALSKYITRLKDFWDEDNECWRDEIDSDIKKKLENK